jgi:hypothetical protein
LEHLGISMMIQNACTMDREAPSVLVDLLLTQAGTATIWYVRWEQRTHGEMIRQKVRTAQGITALVTNYARARKKENRGILCHCWKKPKKDYLKLNVDAAFDVDKGQVQLG